MFKKILLRLRRQRQHVRQRRRMRASLSKRFSPGDRSHHQGFKLIIFNHSFQIVFHHINVSKGPLETFFKLFSTWMNTNYYRFINSNEPFFKFCSWLSLRKATWRSCKSRLRPILLQQFGNIFKTFNQILNYYFSIN